MDATDFATIQAADGSQQCAEVFRKFVQMHSQTFDLTAFTQSGQWPLIWAAMFRLLSAPDTPPSLIPDTLAVLRILSRDATHLNSTSAAQLEQLLRIADLGATAQPAAQRQPDASIAEALKCLCNVVFQSANCQTMCVQNSAIAGLVRRLRTYKDSPPAYAVQYFDMKLLFIITGLNVQARPKLRDDYYGLTYLPEALELIMQQNVAEEEGAGKVAVAAHLSDRQVDLLCEILKVLFNITFRSETEVATEEEDAEQLRRLTSTVHDLLRSPVLNRDKHTELVSHCVNLLTMIPAPCFAELVLRDARPPAAATAATAPSPDAAGPVGAAAAPHLYDGHDVAVLDVLLAFLRQRLTNADRRAVGEQAALVSPVLVVLVKCVRCAAVQRRYVRSVVLPPLRDCRQRPEVGGELRNQLCRLLTAAVSTVRDLAAELLFVLCKENVWRMTKYTGYGNAAGMFANRGLLGGGGGGGLGPQAAAAAALGGAAAAAAAAEYSSESEDSDTEEYKRVQHEINPVLGCREPADRRRTDPFEGMSEEQKEMEAMKLVGLMEQLNRAGVVQPCRIGEDGRPVPVEHILELQEALPEQQAAVKHKT